MSTPSPLTKPPLDEYHTETREREILNEFLRRYFGGAAHVGDDGANHTWPRCAIAFNQAEIHALDDPLIHWNFSNRTTRQETGDGGRLQITDVLNTVYIQVAAGGTADAQDQRCAEVAGYFKALFDSSIQKRSLAQAGLLRVRVMRGPAAISMSALRTRLFVLKSHYEFNVPRG